MAYSSGSGSSGLLEVGIALVLQDRFSNQAREASRHIKQLHQDAKNAINANLQVAEAAANSVNRALSWASNAITEAITFGAEYTDTMVSVQAITDATTEQFREMNQTAKSLGMRTMFDSQEIASGMKYLAMAGTQASDINTMIEHSAMVANATGLALGGKGGAADMLTNVMRMFRMEAAGAAQVVGDQLTKATLSSNISMTDLAESIKYAGADIVMLEQHLPSLAAMVGTLGNAGIQGSMAGTAISNMTRYLNKSISQPKYKGAKALEKIGLSKKDFLDAKGNFLDMGYILEKIQHQIRNMPSVEKNAVLLDIFGVRGQRAAAVLMRDLEGYRNLLHKIGNESAGTAANVVEKRMNSLGGALDQMTSAWQNLKASFAEALAPVLVPLFKSIGVIVEGISNFFASGSIGTFVASFLTLGVVIGRITALIVGLRARWLRLTNDSQVSFKAMIASIVRGWKVAEISAERYAMIERSIIAQRNIGIKGNPNAASAFANPGVWHGSAMTTMSAKGTRLYYIREADGQVKRTVPGKWVTYLGDASATAGTLSGNVATGSKYGALTFLRGAKAKPQMAPLVSGKTSIPGWNPTQLTKVAAGTSKLAKVGSGLLGVFGGPWGLAVSAGFMLLPAVVNALSKNKTASDSNTRALKQNEKATKTLSDQIAHDYLNPRKELEMSEAMRKLADAIGYWGAIIAGKMPNNQAVLQQQINLNGQMVADQSQALGGNMDDLNVAF